MGEGGAVGGVLFLVTTYTLFDGTRTREMMTPRPRFVGDCYILADSSACSILPGRDNGIRGRRDGFSGFSGVTNTIDSLNFTNKLINTDANDLSNLRAKIEIVNATTNINVTTSTIGALTKMRNVSVTFRNKHSTCAIGDINGNLHLLVGTRGGRISPVNVCQVMQFGTSGGSEQVR